MTWDGQSKPAKALGKFQTASSALFPGVTECCMWSLKEKFSKKKKIIKKKIKEKFSVSYNPLVCPTGFQQLRGFIFLVVGPLGCGCPIYGLNCSLTGRTTEPCNPALFLCCLLGVWVPIWLLLLFAYQTHVVLSYSVTEEPFCQSPGCFQQEGCSICRCILNIFIEGDKHSILLLYYLEFPSETPSFLIVHNLTLLC